MLIAEDPSLRSLVSTFLVTMGCACAVVSNREEIDAIIEREKFDAVLLHADHPQLSVEQTLLKVEESRPSLRSRILVIRSAQTDAKTLELIERHDLRQVAQETLMYQLWAAVQELFVAPRSNPAPHVTEVAKKIFDSLRVPVPLGIRGIRTDCRQLAFQHENATIDLLIEPVETSGRVSITGQILHSAKSNRENDGIPVFAVSAMQTIARASTNEIGEFTLECESVEEVTVELRLGQGTWVSLPVGRMEWIRGSTLESQPPS